MLGASQAALLGAAGCAQKPSTYAGTVTGIPGLLAYWRLADTSGVIDATAGGRHGTYDGAVSLVPGLPMGGDAATFLPGTVRGFIPHDAGLLLPAFTLSLWFSVTQIDTLTVLFSKDASGIKDGHFYLQVRPGGELRVVFQITDEENPSGIAHDISIEGIIQPNTPYHVAVTARSQGFDLWLDGRYLDTNDSFFDGWTNNAEDIEIGSVFFTSNIMSGVLDEIALYSRALDDTEIVALSQNTTIPVAASDSISVTENTSAVINVLPDCSFVGHPENLMFEFIQGDHGTASVNEANAIVYTANANEGGETDSFQYRITDPNGTSEYATISVSIQDADDGQDVGDIPAALINPFPASSGDTVVVSSIAALVSAVNAAPPGRHILIAAGTYAGGTQTFTGQGTAANPIVIRPQGERGSVTINSPTWTLASSSTRLVFTNLYFNNGRINLAGPNNRISRCRWRQVMRQSIAWSGDDNRVDHNDISDYTVSGDDNRRFLSFGGTVVGMLFDHNYWHDLTTNAGSDALIFCSSGPSWNRDPELYIERNLLQNVDNNARFLTVKNSRMRIRFCTFENLDTYLQQRQGGGWEVRSCWFQSGLNSNTIIGFDDACAGFQTQLIIGNRLIGGLGIRVGCGQTTSCGPTDGRSYHRSLNGRVIGNTLDTGTIVVGWLWSAETKVIRASGNLIAGNVRNGAPATTSNGIVLDFQENTTIQSTTTELYVPAVKLTPSDVGMAAPDPYDPSGPQS